MERVYSGTFRCEDCDIEYVADGDPESQLVCEECGGDLDEVGNDDDEEDEADDEEM